MLEQCTQLTSLQLLGCTGPLTDGVAAAGPRWRPPAFRLRDLHIGWAGAGRLTDGGLAALLHPDRAALRSLVLKGCSSLTDGAWVAVAQHGGTLECLHLDRCGTLPRHAKSGAPPDPGHAPMTAHAAAAAAASCRRLLALTVAHCCMWPPGGPRELESHLRDSCPTLQTLHLL